jgi:hypothetical protein
MQYKRLTMCTDILSIFKFVKIYHSPAQVLSNKKKSQLFASSVG